MENVRVAGNTGSPPQLDLNSGMSKGRNPASSGLHKRFGFSSFGVGVTVESDQSELLLTARAVVHEAFGETASFFESAEGLPQDHVFGITKEKGVFVLYKNGQLQETGESERNFFNYLNSLLRLEVAEFAVERVFIHSGVVEQNGLALLLPGISGSGKSTLTAELVRQGAVYYSDEYAVIDGDGLVWPFPRNLSLDVDGPDGEQKVSAASLGGRSGTLPIQVGMVLFTRFEKPGEWEPEYLSPGAGIMELIPNTLTLRKNPAFALKVLDLAAQRAIILKSPRGEAKSFAQFLLNFFDKNTKLAKMT